MTPQTVPGTPGKPQLHEEMGPEVLSWGRAVTSGSTSLPLGSPASRPRHSPRGPLPAQEPLTSHLLSLSLGPADLLPWKFFGDCVDHFTAPDSPERDTYLFLTLDSSLTGKLGRLQPRGCGMLKENRFCSEWAPKILARGLGSILPPGPQARARAPEGLRSHPPPVRGPHGRKASTDVSLLLFLALPSCCWPGRLSGRREALRPRLLWQGPAGREAPGGPPCSAVSSSLPRLSYCLSQGQLHLPSLGQALISCDFNQSGATDGISGIRDLDGRGTVSV